MAEVFLSYSREDQAIARQFAEGLTREGFGIWWDQALNAGEAFDQVTERALHEAKAVVVLWSRHSVESRWVRAEATEAQAGNRLVPVMIEACKRPIMFELTHTADLADWSGDAVDPRWRSFIDGLARSVGRTGASSTGAWAMPAAAPAAVSATASRRTLRQPFAWVAAIAAVAIATGLFWFFHGKQTGAPTAALDASIAVLPFDDMSQGKDQGYFADGVAEEILNMLARIPDPNLKVTARNSSFAPMLKGKDLKDVGKMLGVTHLLEGSVRKAGNQVLITAQLIRTDTGFHLWSKTYERPITDIFAVQEEVARSVAESLQVSLGVGIGHRPGMTRNAEAYDDYLASGALIAGQYTTESRRRAIELLQSAVERDPSFGLAWAQLSDTYLSMTLFTTETPQVWLAKAGAAFKQFEHLMPGSVELHLALAGRSMARGSWTEVAKHVADATAAAKAAGISGTVSSVPGRVLVQLGHVRDGLAALQQEKAHDPLNVTTSIYLAFAYGAAGDFPAAFAESERGDRLGTGLLLTRNIALQNALGTGDRKQVLRWLDAVIGIEGEDMRVIREYNTSLKQRLDRPAEALAFLRQQAHEPSTVAVALGGMAQWMAYFGDPQDALDVVRLARQRGLADADSIGFWSPVMRDVRKLPDFKHLVREMGLVDIWRDLGWGDFCKPTTGDDFECQ